MARITPRGVLGGLYDEIVTHLRATGRHVEGLQTATAPTVSGNALLVPWRARSADHVLVFRGGLKLSRADAAKGYTVEIGQPTSTQTRITPVEVPITGEKWEVMGWRE